MRKEIDSYKRNNIEILVIGPDDKAGFMRYWEKEALPFRGLPDPDLKVLKLLGQQFKMFNFGRMPATLLIDTGGKVLFAYYGESMRDIPGSAEILDTLAKKK